MAYRRNYRRPYPRRRNYRKRYPKRSNGYASMAYKGLRLATRLARLVNVEKKMYEIQNTLTPATTGTVVALANPAQGDTDITRDGDSIKPLNLHIKLLARFNSSATRSGLRVTIVRTKYERAVQPTLLTVFGSSTPALVANKDWDNRFDTKILYDRVFRLDAEHEQFMVDKMIRLDGHIQFDGGSTDTNNGGIFMLVYSDEATNYPSLLYQTRMIFVDN